MNKLKNVILTLLLFAGGVVTLLFSYQQILESVQTGSWPTANGTIIQSEVRKDFSGDAWVYYPEISYRYTVKDQDYTGSRVAMIEYRTSLLAESETVVQRHPTGSEVKVSYNQDDPASAVLEPGVQLSIWWLLPLAGLGLALLGLVGTLTNIRSLVSESTSI